MINYISIYEQQTARNLNKKQYCVKLGHYEMLDINLIKISKVS